jgi:hypothetical protein
MIKRMLKTIGPEAKCPKDCYVLANIWTSDDIVGKIISKYNNTGRTTGNPKSKNRSAVDKMLKVDDKKCPFCDKQLSCKSAVMRHMDTACAVLKMDKMETKKVEHETGFSDEIVLPPHQYVKNATPNTKLRDIIYIAGAQGSGKSTYVRHYCNDFIVMFKDKGIVLLSRLNEDKAFKDLIDKDKMISIDINDPDIIDDPIDAKIELADTLTIFDDYAQFDKDIRKSIQFTLQDCLLNGRSQADNGDDTYVCVTGHQITDYAKTRDLLNEASSIVVFPKAGQVHGITRCCKIYCGMNKRQIDKIFGLDTRWVCIHKRFPMYVMWEGGCYTL